MSDSSKGLRSSKPNYSLLLHSCVTAWQYAPSNHQAIGSLFLYSSFKILRNAGYRVQSLRFTNFTYFSSREDSLCSHKVSYYIHALYSQRCCLSHSRRRTFLRSGNLFDSNHCEKCGKACTTDGHRDSQSC